jgi:hypothetical protein
MEWGYNVEIIIIIIIMEIIFYIYIHINYHCAGGLTPKNRALILLMGQL